MTDTGQVPGEGLPENAGMVEQPGVLAPGTYTFLDHSGGAPEAVPEDDDLLLMPGAQGAWSDPQTAAPAPTPAAAPAPATEPVPAGAPGAGHVQPAPAAQDATAARHTPVPGARSAPGYTEAETAAAPVSGQPHGFVAQEQQQYAGDEPRLPRAAEQHAARTPAVSGQAVSAHAAGAHTVPVQGVPSQAAARPPVPEPAVAGQAVVAGQAAAQAPQPAQGQPAAQGRSAAHGQPVGHGPDGHGQSGHGQSGHGQPVAHGRSAARDRPSAETQGTAGHPVHEAGAHETGGRDSGSLDLGGVRMPPGAAPAQAPAQARRPLHMGPPVPEANSGVVRSLADRGPAAHRGGSPAPRQSAMAAPVAGPPTGGLEYLDMLHDDADLPPGQQPEEIPPQGGDLGTAQPAQAPTAVTVPEEAAPEEAAPEAAPALDETVPPQTVLPSAGPAADTAEAVPAPPYPAGAPAGAVPEPTATEQFVPAAEDASPTGSQAGATPMSVATPGSVAMAGSEAVAPAPEEPTDARAAAPSGGAAVQAAEVSAPAPAPEPLPVAVSEPVPAPVAGSASGPAVAPERVAPTVPGGPAEPLPAAEAVTATGPGTGDAADHAGAEPEHAGPPEHAGQTVEAVDGAQPAGSPVARTGDPSAAGPAPGAPSATEHAPEAGASTDAGPHTVPATVEHATAVTVPAQAEATAAQVEPAVEQPVAGTQPDTGAEAETEPVEQEPAAGTQPDTGTGTADEPAVEQPAAEAEPGGRNGAEPVAEGAPPAGGDREADAGETRGTPAPGYADSEREAVLRVMRERRDIRNGFRSDPIPHDVLLRVLEAAHTAPSVGHSQPWDFVVIRSAETRRSMHELAQRQREAYAKSLPKGRAKQFKELKIEAILDTPVNIVVTADSTRGGRHTLGRHTQPQMAPYSSALAVENLWLAARAEGLGVGWVSFFDEREMVRALGLPEHLEVVAYLCVGYVDEFPEEPELMQAGWSKRRPLSWVVHEETYGRRALPGAEPHDLLQETVSGIRPLDAKALGEAWERQKRMTKPAGALGMLEIISAQLSGLSRMCPPPIPEPAAVAIFAGDHGVHAQGVTAWPQEVTGQMVANFLGGGAVCNAFANQVGAEVCVIDVGVASDLPATPGLLPRKVRPGTADFTTGPALSREEVHAAIDVGIETARDLVSAGNKALLTGEMGIANTTASAALITVYTGADPAEVTGRGTGINDEMHARKVDVVRRALELHQPDAADPVGALAAVGGLEHAALVGFILGGASLRTPVVLDGVSAGAAALVARAVAPEALAACIAGHRSAEPGHVAALNKLGLRPLVDLDLRLGEGTGALLALPLVQSAARAMHEVATFDSAGVTEK
ncbi:nicotinate-nucleotide--dimethylbenzimidazole phosphoribosyltransferase [Streptomyces sp. NPDC049910]|uniref:nicotinate-nucleotide--dimethylbenzimidazole phosphoribosyltransferase n=1 Tax=Streptomyces sp. NPDC049910 TaxID=3155278 RepID=UPI00343E97EE